MCYVTDFLPVFLSVYFSVSFSLFLSVRHAAIICLSGSLLIGLLLRSFGQRALVVVVYHVTIVAIGHGLLKKF